MAKRDPRSRLAHSRGILQEAQELQNGGWIVRADHIGGYLPAYSIDGFVPDIIATKSGWTRIVEIETDENEDELQHAAFQNYAKHNTRARFYGWVVDDSGNRQSTIE